MFSLTDILVGFALPAVLCGMILLAAWWPWRRGATPDGRWAGAIAIGAGYAIAYGRLVGDLHFPPASVDNWIVYVMPVVMVLGVAFCRLPRAALPRVAAVVVVSAIVSWFIIKPLIGSELTRNVAAAQIAASAVAMTAWWLVVNELARRGPRMLAPAVVVLVSAGASVVLGEAGLAIRGGLPLAALAGIALAATVVAAIIPRFRLNGGGTLAVTVILFGTFLYAYFYMAEPTPRLLAAMPILAGSPVLAWVAWFPGIRRRPIWQRGMIAFVLVLLAVGSAVALVEWPGHPVADDAISL